MGKKLSMGIDKDLMSKHTPSIYPKGWGRELWIFNSEKYCGKILEFKEGKKCSWHYHEIKDEVFFVQSGRMEIAYSWENDLELAKRIVLEKGESFHVPTGLRHQMMALEKSELFEISTMHVESDSIRLVRGD